MVGVFTHLDQFQSQKLLSATKKRLKDWFWTEIHDGVKMFHFSGVVNGWYYLKNKVSQLSLFLLRAKFRLLMWRNMPPNFVVDRHEDMRHPNAVCWDLDGPRSVSFYGYVQGTRLRSSTRVHLLGLSDHDLADVRALEDPCPLTATTGTATNLDKR